MNVTNDDDDDDNERCYTMYKTYSKTWQWRLR